MRGTLQADELIRISVSSFPSHPFIRLGTRRLKSIAVWRTNDKREKLKTSGSERNHTVNAIRSVCVHVEVSRLPSWKVTLTIRHRNLNERGRLPVTGEWGNFEWKIETNTESSNCWLTVQKGTGESRHSISFHFGTTGTNWRSLQERCSETGKSRSETFRGEPSPIELWLVADARRREKKNGVGGGGKNEGGSRATAFFTPSFFLFSRELPASSLYRREFAKSSPLPKYKLLKLPLAPAAARDLWRRKFATRPKSLFFIGKSSFPATCIGHALIASGIFVDWISRQDWFFRGVNLRTYNSVSISINLYSTVREDSRGFFFLEKILHYVGDKQNDSKKSCELNIDRIWISLPFPMYSDFS